MQDIKMKPNLAAQMSEHEMPEWKGNWANSYGRHLGTGRYDSAKEARAAYLRLLPTAIAANGWNCHGSIYPARGFVIQIPIK